jgi:hypothetical protein
MRTILKQYYNGDCYITLYSDGTRIIKGNYLNYPLNIDIRVSTSCSFGQRDDGSFVLCDFCHESAKVNGKDCDYELLKSKLLNLPPIELAIGCNQFTDKLKDFLFWCKDRFICNLTINSGHIKRDQDKIQEGIKNQLFYGLGISYRKGIPIPQWVIDYPNTIIHVIVAIDDLNDILEKNFPKILVLGCKDFGFNLGKLNQEKIKDWYRNIHLLFNNQVSFDNLALEQLNLKRFFSDETWDIINQGEESFYIDAANQRFSKSSRSSEFTNWDEISVKEFYVQNKRKSI